MIFDSSNYDDTFGFYILQILFKFLYGEFKLQSRPDRLSRHTRWRHRPDSCLRPDLSVFMAPMVSVHGPHGQCLLSTWSVFMVHMVSVHFNII